MLVTGCIVAVHIITFITLLWGSVDMLVTAMERRGDDCGHPLDGGITSISIYEEKSIVRLTARVGQLP
jgi:hypothetical protein